MMKLILLWNKKKETNKRDVKVRVFFPGEETFYKNLVTQALRIYS